MQCSGDVLARIRDSLVELRLDEVLRLVEEALKLGVSARDIVFRALSDGMRIIGEKFERGEYYLAELLLASEIFKECLRVLEPKLVECIEASGEVGTVVIGTVRGDIHDIGKNLVATMLRAAGFKVIDLGVDVPPEKFVEAVERYGADIVAMSALLTTVLDEMRRVIELLREKGLRDRVKVIIGGLPTTEEFAKSIGADAWGRDAVDAVEKCRALIRELKSVRTSHQ